MSFASDQHNFSNQHDETHAVDGRGLPHWKMVVSALENLNSTDIELRQQDISRQLRANGIAYSSLSDTESSARPWHLDLAPLVIEVEDWQTITQALQQRAKLKQLILRDIYGKQLLLKERVIPPAMVLSHKGYLRDAINMYEHLDLPIFCSDISRAPSGNWYVVDDICQYPEGIGYALENRLVLSSTLLRLFRGCRVQRIASYFKYLQKQIISLSESEGRCVILANGPEHPHYFEYAFLAKYLGYTLVQTGDLTVRDNRVYIRTVSDLQRVSVIVRLMDDSSLDPMATGQGTSGGIAGLFQAVKSGGVKIINPIGSGVLNNPALNTCMPQLCQHLLGEELLMQGPPTYWLGDEKQLHAAMSRRDHLLFRDINSLGYLSDPRLMDVIELQELEKNIELYPYQYVAQERVDRSVAPSFDNTTLVAQQITVRSFLINEGDDYFCMPGGLCLLDTDSHGKRQAFDSLSGSKDTWVIAEGLVKPVSLLNDKPVNTQFAVLEGELPSRVAENLFWMGRNAERAEKCVRLLRSVFQTLQAEDTINTDMNSVDEVAPELSAILRATSQACGTLPGFVGRGGAKRIREPQRELISLLFDLSRTGTLPNTLNQLQISTASLRDRVSDELLSVLNRLDDEREALAAKALSSLDLDDNEGLKTISNQLDNILLLLSAFTGITHENFTHGDGWRFMMLGRRLERVQHSCSVMNTMMTRDPHNVALLETLLKLFDSTMTYRSRYRSQIDARLVLRLLINDELNPRSLAFQLKEIQDAIHLLPGRRSLTQADELGRLTISALSRVQLVDPQTLITSGKDARQNLSKLLSVVENYPAQIAVILSATYFSHVETATQIADLSPTHSSDLE